MQTVYEAAGGLDGMRRLAPRGTPGSWPTTRSATPSATATVPITTNGSPRTGREALGGPAAYTDAYGDETSVVRIHSGNGEHAEMDRRAIACFDQALTDAGLADGRLRQVLHDYFAWATTTTMARYHQSAADVPDGLPIPRWSWDGLVTGTGPPATT